MTRLLLIRHATTNAVGKTLSGRSAGVQLNDAGIEQARNLTERIKHLPIAAVYSSPMERAVATAEPIAQSLGLGVQVMQDFQELDFGNWTNKTFEDLASEHSFQRFNTFRSCARVPGGETMLEAQTRFVSGVEKLQQRHPGQTLAIISHADLIKSAIAYYAGIHLDMFQRLEISPASVSMVELYEETVRIVLLNHMGEIQL